MIRVTPGIVLPDRELDFQFARAGGPGGQNVNKVSSAVQLRFNVEASTSLPAPVRARLVRIAGNRITGEGYLLITARNHRTQDQNRREALNRLVALIRRAAAPVRERKKTAPSRSVREERLAGKRRAGEKKLSRRRVAIQED